MSHYALLNNISHQHTKVMHYFSQELGDNQASALAFPTEFNELQKEYPILIRRDQPDGSYQASVLLGLEAGENLYLDPNLDSGWDAFYIPAQLERGPFLIGFQNQPGAAIEELTPVVHIDMAHPKVNEQHGQALFLSQGGNSPYLEHISARLQLIHKGMALAPVMFSAFSQLDLIEPATIEFSLSNGEKYRLTGNYCINTQRLAALSGAELDKLHHSGFLQLAFAMVNSMSNISRLIERKNRQLQHVHANR